MKFRAMFKTPDSIFYAIKDATEDDEKRAELDEFTEKWIKYGECVTIEFDTDAKTCTVMEAK
jgi:hypothetical protein